MAKTILFEISNKGLIFDSIQCKMKNEKKHFAQNFNWNLDFTRVSRNSLVALELTISDCKYVAVGSVLCRYWLGSIQ